MMLDIDKLRKVTKLDYPKKCIIQKVRKCGQNDSFRIFVENGSNNFAYFFGQNVEEMDTKHLQQTACPLKIFIHKVAISAKNVESKNRSISRTINTPRTDLISGIYIRFPFAHVSSDFSLFVVFIVKI